MKAHCLSSTILYMDAQKGGALKLLAASSSLKIKSEMRKSGKVDKLESKSSLGLGYFVAFRL